VFASYQDIYSSQIGEPSPFLPVRLDPQRVANENETPKDTEKYMIRGAESIQKLKNYQKFWIFSTFKFYKFHNGKSQVI